MSLQAIRSDNPRPLANYTEAFRVGPLVFAAGQLATDFKTGIPAAGKTDPNFPYYGSDIKLQTRYILENCRRTFEAAGSSLNEVIKAQVFLTELRHFSAFDEVWKEFFQVPPARTTVGTTDLLIKDALIEIDLIGCISAEAAPKAIQSDIPRPLANYTDAFCVGDLVFAAGQLPTDFKTGIPAAAKTDPNFPFYGSDIKLQTRYILENLKKTFAAAGSSLDKVVKAQVFLTNLADFAGFDEVWKQYFATPPARTTVGTTGLLVKDALIEIDLIGTNGNAKPVPIQSDIPRPLANYTEAFRVGDLVFAAGQLPTDFKTGIPTAAKIDPNFPFYGSNIKLQTRYVLENLKQTFAAAGTSLDRVAKAQVFLLDLKDFSAFDEVWKEYFPVPPARTTVGTSGLLVKNALIEIDLIGTMPQLSDRRTE
jgi:reactive intermediate/imine deaminase